MRQLLKDKRIVIVFAAVILAAFFCLYKKVQENEDEGTIVTIAVQQNEQVKNFQTNYYKKWLEEQTGYTLRFEYIAEGYEKEYLNAMLMANPGRIDAVFLSGDEGLLSTEELNAYVDAGFIQDLSAYMTRDSHLYQMTEDYKDYHMKDQLCYRNGYYYMPNMDTSRVHQNMQVLWINMGWLRTLGLQIPTDTEELRTVLRAFRDGDPNGNGLADELPLISCESNEALQSYHYLLNAFFYQDPLHGQMLIQNNGGAAYAATDSAVREGLKYCAGLFEEGLLSDTCLLFSRRQLTELANAQEDMVGAFTSQSIADVIYPDCSNILARFIQVPPIKGPKGEQHAVYSDLHASIGGYIPANSTHPKEAYELMDLMLSEQAALIDSFGEEGIDWKYSENGDLSTYGSQARITTLRYLKDAVQNQNFAGTGPVVLAPEYSNGVTWNGNNSLVEYIDARAVRSYESFYCDKREELRSVNLEAPDRKKDIHEMTLQFIFGSQNLDSDAAWKDFEALYN